MQLHWSESPPRNLPRLSQINLRCAKYNDSGCSLLKPDCGSILHCVLQWRWLASAGGCCSPARVSRVIKVGSRPPAPAPADSTYSEERRGLIVCYTATHCSQPLQYFTGDSEETNFSVRMIIMCSSPVNVCGGPSIKHVRANFCLENL